MIFSMRFPIRWASLGLWMDVWVALALGVKHKRNAAVGDEGGETDHAHDLGPRHSAVEGMPRHAGEHPQRESDQGATLGDGPLFFAL
jgi:hypothetical protein